MAEGNFNGSTREEFGVFREDGNNFLNFNNKSVDKIRIRSPVAANNGVIEICNHLKDFHLVSKDW
jgi:hypothetical protein